jgi:hypothetical protein
MAFPDEPFDPFAAGPAGLNGVPQLPGGFGEGQDPFAGAGIPMDLGPSEMVGFEEEIPPELYQLGPDGEMVAAPGEDELPAIDPQEFRANLAELLDDDYLNKMGRQIVEDTQSDIEARQPWTDRFKRGMEMMGLIKSDMDDGPFPGASTAVHPLITEAVVQFWARAMGEQVPADGPAKSKIIGKQTEMLVARGKRVADYMNHEMMFVDDGWYPEHSRSMFGVPMQGCVFKKIYRDDALDRNVSVMVQAEDFIAPAGITDLKTTPRFTHRLWRTDNDLNKAFASGMYREVDLGEVPEEERSEEYEIKQEATDQEEGDDTTTNEWELFECYCEWELPQEIEPNGTPGIALPYTVTVEKTTGKVLSIYRGWKSSDPLKRRRVRFVKYGYVPGFGLYDLGLFHLMGGLQQAATGALRVLLDGAATSSLQGGFVAKDANMKDQRLEIEPGVWKPLDATSEELNKAFFTPPFKEPSAALMTLLDFLTTRAEKFTATTEIMTGETNAKAPVGSVVAVIEQAAKVFSTIHRGLHMSMAQELRLRFELIQENMPAEGYPYDVEGAHEGILKEDFAPGVSIQPVSDPNIFSSAQRVAVAQATYQVAQENPDIVDRKVAVRRVLDAIRAPDVDELMISSKPPPPMDPVGEVQALLRGEPVQAYPDQMHEAHLQHLAAFASNPQYGGNPEVQKQIGPSLMAIIGQHLAYAWATASRALGAPAPLLPPAMGLPGEGGDQSAPPQNPMMGGQPQLPSPDMMGMPQGPHMMPDGQMMGAPNGNMDPSIGGQNGMMVPSGNMANGAPPPTNAPPELIAQMAARIAPQMAQIAGLPPIEGEKDDTQAKLQIEQEKLGLKKEEMGVRLAFERDKNEQDMQHEGRKFQFEMQRDMAKTRADIEAINLKMDAQRQQAQLDSELAIQNAAMTAEQQKQQMVNDQAQAQFDRAQQSTEMMQDRMASDQDRALQREDAAQSRIIRSEESKSKQQAQKAQANKPKPKGK